MKHGKWQLLQAGAETVVEVGSDHISGPISLIVVHALDSTQ